MMDPILVDVLGRGYHLTDLANGVAFSCTGTGPQQISWTDANAGNAWLVLDRNSNGIIDNGTELFGNLTPQTRAPGVTPNGFRALAEYDKPENGGNGNGLIDPGDAIWKYLRLWIDLNHNGISEPVELRTLDEFGIGAFELNYKLVSRRDRYGNRFRYQGKIIEKDGKRGQRTIWDVILLHGANASFSPAASSSSENVCSAQPGGPQ
jgi:hypothetical protein